MIALRIFLSNMSGESVISLFKMDSKFEAMLKHNPNAKLITFEDTSHLLMFEKSKEFVAAVKDFLKSTSNGPVHD
ncbi:UNVERIFIED_CONTAM: hypothetical protein NCL1_38211 [Trichonephila clavipes]